MTYDYDRTTYDYDRTASQKEAGWNRNYQNAKADALAIATEVISTRYSAIWVAPAEDQMRIAAEVEQILAKFNIGYEGAGRWAHKVGGSKTFKP